MVIQTCARCGAKNRVDEAAASRQQAVCGKCGAKLNGATTTGEASSAGASLKPETVTDASFAHEVLHDQENRPVLVDCWAEWCSPCRVIAPILDQLAAESSGRYRIAKLNVDDNPQTASRFQIQSIPTLLIFKQGKLVDRLVGAQPKQVIAARLSAHI